MTTNAQTSVGASLKRGDGGSNEQFTEIAEINSIGGPDKSREMIDVTTLDSTGGYDEFIPSFRDGGMVTLNCNWTRDDYENLLGDFDSDSSVNYQIVINDTGATTYDFTGYVQSIGRAIPNKGKIEMTISIKVTGQETMSS